MVWRKYMKINELIFRGKFHGLREEKIKRRPKAIPVTWPWRPIRL
jgi:hypothetical protein